MTYSEYDSESKEHLQISQTSCKDCIFATYEEDQPVHEKPLQIGCRLGRIDIYSAQGNVVEAFDYEKDFYLIHGRICSCCRKSDYADREQLDLDGLILKVRQDVKLKFDLMVIAEHSMEDVKKTIDAAVAEEYRPYQLTVIRKLGSQIRPSTLREYLDSLGIKWRIQSITNPALDERDMIDNGVPGSKCGYYISVRAGSVLPDKYLETLDSVWNDKLIQLGVVIVSPDDPVNFMMVSRSVHSYLSGNDGFELEYKIKEYNDTLIHNYGDLL